MEDSRISTVDHEAVSNDFASGNRNGGLAADISVDQRLPLSQNADVAAFELAQAAEQQANGKTARVAAANEPQNAGARQPIQIVPDNGNVVHLPPNTSIDDIHVEGRNLVLIQADGTRIVIINGALHVPTFLIGEVTLPQQAVVAALQQQGVNVAEGPDGSVHAGNSTSSGHQFTDSQAANARTPLNLIGLLGPGGQFGGGNGGTNTQGNQDNNRGQARDSVTAAADTGSLQSGADVSADTAHGVLANDASRAGGLQVVGVAAGSTTAAQSEHVGSAIATTLGTLTLNADGSYSYHANANESGTDTFSYTVKDADGSLSTTTLTFTVADGRTEQPATPDQTALSEANLPGGTAPSEQAVTATGSITLADPDAPHITSVLDAKGASVTVDASGTTTVQGTYGTLTIDADGKYSYTLTTAGVHAGGEQESFTYTVTDDHGNTTTSTLSFSIADDAPVAQVDTGSLQSGADVSADAASGVLANDVTGADGGLEVVGVAAGSTTAAQSEHVGSAIATTLGTLTLNADGSYSYHANANESGTDTFSYTVKDADGSLSTTTLTFTVADGRTEQPATPDQTVLSEANLPGGTAPSEQAVTATGSITLADPDAPHITSVLDAKGASVIVDASGTTRVQGTYGTLTIDADGKYSYTLTTAGVHAGGEQESFTYTVTDDHGNTTTSTLSFSIADDAPVAQVDTGSLQSGADVSADAASGVLANDVTGADGGLEVVGVAAGSTTAAQSEHVGSAIATTLGTLTLNADGSYSYHANANESGTDTFSYTVKDADGSLSTTTLTFTVADGRTEQPATPDQTALSEANLPGGTAPSEQAVTATGSIALADPDAPHITSVLDAKGASVTVDASGTTTVQGTYGTLTIDADGKYSYTLTTAGVHAGGEQESFTYTVTDDHGNTTTSTLSFSIADDAPVAQVDTGSLQSGADVSADAASGVLANDVTGADGGLEVVGVAAGSTTAAQSEHVGSAIATTLGTLTLNADGSYSYHANANESGTDTFSYTVKDADGSLSTTTLTFTVADGRTEQPATPDQTALSEANLPGGTAPSEQAVTATGSIALADPDAPHITSVLDAKGASVTVDASGTTTVQGTYGTLTIDADGKYSYTLTTAGVHAGGEQESFTYTVTDDHGNTTTSTLSFSIADDAPVAQVDTGSLQSGADVSADAASGVLANDVTGADGGLEVVGVAAGSTTAAQSEHVGSAIATTLGTLTLNADGSYSYHANANESGTDTFSYTVKDADGSLSTTTLTFTVADGRTEQPATPDQTVLSEANLPGGTAPSEQAVTATGSITLADPDAPHITSVLDAKGASVTVDASGTTTVQGTYGTLTIDADGKYSYTLTTAGVHAGGEQESFTYTVTDDHGNTTTSTLSFSIADDAPVAQVDTGSLQSGADVSADAASGVLANDVTGADGGLEVVGVAAGSTTAAQSEHVGSAIATTLGTLTLNADGSYSYHANANESGTDTFSYTVKDADGSLSTTTLTFTVADGRTEQPATPDQTALSEANLPGGTAPSEQAVTATGSIALADPDAPHITSVLDAKGASVTVDASGTTRVQGTYGTLTIDADGKYSYTLTTAGVHAGGEQESFTYTVTDDHGNTTTSTLSFSIADDAPVVGTVDQVSIDEHGLVSASSATVSGLLGITSFGADSAAANNSVAFSSATPVDADGNSVTLTSHGQAVHFVVVGATLYGYTGDVPASGTAPATNQLVFTVALAAPDGTHATGAYDFTLYKPLDDGDSTNNLSDIKLTFGYTATDGDGSQNAGSFTVDVIDDVPTLVDHVTASATVSETAINAPLVTTASYAIDFDTVTPATAGLTVIEGSVSGDHVGSSSKGGDIVLVSNTGTTFVLTQMDIGVFDHNGASTKTVTIIGTDAQGHTYSVTTVGTTFSAAGTALEGKQLTSLAIDPHDSSLKVTADNIHVTDTTTTPTNDPAETTLDLTSLVHASADSPLTWSLNTVAAGTSSGNLTGGTGLTYNGTAITLAGTDGHTITGSAGGVTVFTLTVDPTSGHATFDLYHPIDGGNALPLDFSKYVTATDFDGDSVTLGDGSVTIVVQSAADNLPTISSANLISSVSESGLPGGTGVDGVANVHSGSIAIVAGDAPSTVTIDGHTFSVGAAIANGDTNATIQGSYGTLQILSVTTTAINYTYKLTTATSGTGNHDAFSVTISDAPIDGESQTAALTFNITDDKPVAHTTWLGSMHENDSSATFALASGTIAFGADGAAQSGAIHVDSVSASGDLAGSTLSTSMVMIDAGHVTVTPGSALDALALGHSSTLSIGYTVTDGDGSQTSGTFSIRVYGVNHAPNTADGSVSTGENTDYQFKPTDFAFSDSIDGNALKTVTITNLPTGGTLYLGGTAVTVGQHIAASALSTLHFTPSSGFAGATETANFGFTVQDNGGTANGGVDTSTAHTMTVTVTAVDDGKATVSIDDETTHTGNAVVVGDTLNAAIATDDPDHGQSGLTYAWSWADDQSHTVLGTGSSYAVTSADVGHSLILMVSYTDGQGFSDVATQTTSTVIAPTVFAPTVDTTPLFESHLSGGSDPQPSELTATGSIVLGTLDNPHITSVAGADNTAVAVDQTAPDSQTPPIHGSYGDLVIDANGAYTYTLLHAGSNPSGDTDQFTYTVTDANGKTAQETLTFNIADDAPTLTGTGISATLSDDGVVTTAEHTATTTAELTSLVNSGADSPLTWSANAVAAGTSSDTLTGGTALMYNGAAITLDSSDGHTITGSAGGVTVFTLTVDSSGHAMFVLDQTIDGAKDQTLDFSQYVKATDSDGDSVTLGTGAFTIAMDHVNHPAEIGGVGIGAVTEDLNVFADGSLQVSDTLTINDADRGESKFQATTIDPDNTHLGTLTIDVDGNWSYKVDDSLSAVQSLGANQSKTDTFTVSSVDGTTHDIVVTINGTNDPAVISGDIARSVTEDGGVNNGTTGVATANGTLSATDVDSDHSFAAQSNVATSYGQFTIDADGQWSYTLDNGNTSVQALNSTGSNTTLHDLITVTTADGTQQQIDITINGANDAAVISGDVAKSVTEDGGVNNGTTGVATANGTLSATDVDSGHSFTAQSNVATSYGQFTIGADGQWSYTLDNSNASVQALNSTGSNTTLHDLITVTTADGTQQQIDITINGANDAAVLGSTASTASYTAGDAAMVLSSTTTVADVDNTTLASAKVSISSGFASGDVLSATLTGTSITASYNAATGVLTLTGNDTLAHYQAVLDSVMFSSTSSSAATRTISWSVNDGAVDSSVSTTTLTVTAQQDVAPVLDLDTTTTGNDASISYTKNARAVILAPHAVVTDVDSANFDGGNLTVSAQSSSDKLDIKTQGFITTAGTQSIGSVFYNGNAIGTYSYSNGQATLTVTFNASATPTAVTALLESIQYSSTSSTADNRVVNFSISDGDGGISSLAHVTVNYSVKPAGVAGEAVNLALSDPSHHVGAVTLSIAGVPAGWTLSEGTHNADGTWSVVTNDPSSLTVTSPDGVTGAVVLQVTETWVNADGSTGMVTVVDNVEAYAKGSPIFAWSGDDTLTASSGNDTLVFANTIGTDVVHNFDTAHDKIDLIGFAGFTSFADVLAHLSSDASGNAVITLGDGETITLAGVIAAALTADDFLFNETVVTHNAGDMVLNDGALMPFSGTLDNTGSIHLASTGSETAFEIVQHGLTLTGGGTVTLSDDAANVIFGSGDDVTLTNVDNTISGAGQLGDGHLTLVNEGTIIADGSHALVIDTGVSAVSNTGTLEATGTGGLDIHSSVVNDGLLWANGGNIDLEGNVSGSGTALVSGHASLEIGGSFSEAITLSTDAQATITIDHAAAFTGTIAGLDGNDALRFGDISAATASLSYAENASGTGGVLTVTDGNHTASIGLTGDYSAGDFSLGHDGDYAEIDFSGLGHLYGTDGSDTLTSGGGYTMTGGAGADTFVLDAQALHNLNMADVITDFSPKGEGDKLDVSNLLNALVGEHPGMTEASAVASMTAAVDTATNSTKISINTGSETHVVATLQNYTPTGHDAVHVLFNNHDEQLATHTQTAGA